MKKNLKSYLFLFITAAVFVLNSCNSTEISESKLSEKKDDISELVLSFSGDIMAHDVNFKMKDYNRIYGDVLNYHHIYFQAHELHYQHQHPY